ncbi:hypothetical protein DdX_13913 [Ditylenchus destructor]|uniref:Uncharacterized protein n=1 Tax=Ditylenchus destructor TaxID=166010 RepID=A0AAD4MY04_9BILA|nr:hypothetical protein DdX_13913 [Ditylenchus destructor]
MGLKLLALLGILAVLGHTVSGPPIASSSNIAAQKQPKFLVSKSGFTEGRLKVLKGIISNGGSVQSYDVFTYEEYTIIGQLDRKTAKPFQRSARLLKKNISQLVGRHPDIAKNSTLNGIDDTLKREVKGKKISGPIHAMVMDCKNFMRNLLSEGGEGSWLDVFTFIHSEDPKKEDEWRHLETIHELSKIQMTPISKETALSPVQIIKRQNAGQVAIGKGKDMKFWPLLKFDEFYTAVGQTIYKLEDLGARRKVLTPAKQQESLSNYLASHKMLTEETPKG